MLMNIFDVWAMKLPYRRRMIEEVTSKYYRDFFKEFAGKDILEIGCGHGFGAKAIKKYFSPKKIIATDLDPRMIESARRQIHDKAIEFRVADATKLPFKNDSFSAVFDYGTIHHIPGPLWKDSLREIYRVLARRGKAFIYDNSIESFHTLWGRINRIISVHPYSSMYKKSEFIDELKSVGFTVIKEVNLGRYFIAIVEK